MSLKTLQRSATQLKPVSMSREAVFVAVVIAVVLAITSLPYVYAYASSPPDRQFMGIMLDVSDHAQYFSWMRELSTANLSANKLTPEPNRAVFFNLLWWLLGRTGALLGLGYGAMFQVLRVGAGVLFLLALYRLYALFFKEPGMRATAFLITLFASGFGWVLVLLKYTLTKGELLFPLDVFVAEGNTFLCLMGYPHFIAALLYIFVFDLFLRGESKGKYSYAVWAGIIAFLLGWQHAYDLFIVYGVIGAYFLLRWLRDRKLPIFVLWSAIIVGAISWWPALYSFVLTSLDPLWSEVLSQFKNAGVFTPPLYRLPILLGPAFLFAIYTLIRRNPLKPGTFSNHDLFITGWFLISFVLVYLPVDFQIHMLNGWQIPIAILATQGLFTYVKPAVERLAAKRKWKVADPVLRWGLVGLVVAIVIPTNLYLWAWRFLDLSRHNYPYYLYTEETTAMQWLDDQTTGDEVVLSSEMVGQYIPSWSGTYVFLGHWAQTVDYFGKIQLVTDFFSASTAEEERQKTLRDYGVDYVFFGPAEQALGSYNPAGAAYLEEVYQSPKVAVYKVLDH